MHSLELRNHETSRGYIGLWYLLTSDECRLIRMKDTYLNVSGMTRAVNMSYE